MIDIFSETTLTIHEACQVLPRRRNKSKPHFSTVFRWITEGVKAVDGMVVRLEAARMGETWLTSKEALQRFSDRLAGDRGDVDGGQAAAGQAGRSPKVRERAAKSSADRLTQKGI